MTIFLILVFYFLLKSYKREKEFKKLKDEATYWRAEYEEYSSIMSTSRGVVCLYNTLSPKEKQEVEDYIGSMAELEKRPMC